MTPNHTLICKGCATPYVVDCELLNAWYKCFYCHEWFCPVCACEHFKEDEYHKLAIENRQLHAELERTKGLAYVQALESALRLLVHGAPWGRTEDDKTARARGDGKKDDELGQTST